MRWTFAYSLATSWALLLCIGCEESDPGRGMSPLDEGQAGASGALPGTGDGLSPNTGGRPAGVGGTGGTEAAPPDTGAAGSPTAGAAGTPSGGTGGTGGTGGAAPGGTGGAGGVSPLCDEPIDIGGPVDCTDLAPLDFVEPEMRVRFDAGGTIEPVSGDFGAYVTLQTTDQTPVAICVYGEVIFQEPHLILDISGGDFPDPVQDVLVQFMQWEDGCGSVYEFVPERGVDCAFPEFKAGEEWVGECDLSPQPAGGCPLHCPPGGGNDDQAP